ncbi:Acg family FMN-binding oxidoreductase [Prauserella flavalba]|uniref:Nitroreductase domain-containing protein n=1 Tax=Prauserella flavalba TaxID=1477506 RepID=A0A318LW72_9PSEU|nr:nitroreductase family protein [Prauserella flavalba]PXY36548.1 hypothetical protein BA062_14295 [Prauserella flavalba]
MSTGTVGWSAAEADTLANAVVSAPSVLNTQPWSLHLERYEALLRERRDAWLPYHDPKGRDRAISCGAAVPNLELAVRVLGRETTTILLPDPDRPELVARVVASAEREPDADERRAYAAIARRRSYRLPFAGTPVPADVLATVLRPGAVDGVRAAHVREAHEVNELAAMLEYAAVAQQRDPGYQRELSLWTIQDQRSHRHGVGVAGAALPSPSTLPWAGLARPRTAVPDQVTLARRLADETVLLFHTDDDTRLDHVRVGIAMEHAWLTLVSSGLVAAVQTQPLQLPEVRARLADTLVLPGPAQLLMRIGYPVGPVPRSPRRSTFELLRGD